MVKYLPQLKSSEVLGQTIVDIRKTYDPKVGGVDFAWTFVELASGLTISLYAEFDLGDPLVEQAVSLTRMNEVIGHQISSVWLNDWDDEECYALMMDNGLLILDIPHQEVSVYPPGVYLIQNLAKADWKLTQYWP